MSTSISRSVPSLVTTAVGVTLVIPSVTRSTLSWASAGYQSLEIKMRLQPISKVGVTFSRSSGSLMPLLRFASAARLAGSASLGSTTNDGTSISREK